MPEPATLTAAAIGAAVLTEGIKFLYAQAGEVLKRWRERRDGASGDADSPEVIPVTAPAKVFDGDLRDLEIDLERVAPVEARLRDLRRNLGDYADGVDEVDAKDVSLLAKVDALRTLLETLSRQHITFRGEQRPPSGAPLVIGRVDVEGSIADQATGVASEGIVAGEVRGEVKAQRIEKGGSATGVRTGVIGQRSSPRE